MIRRNAALLAGALAIAGVLAGTTPADARDFRLGMVPNATTVGANCNLCHTAGGGTPRNAFGLDIEKLVTPFGREVFWGPELAALDSDGDGVPNGVELGDPDGTWAPGDANPGDAASITHPGDESSFIEPITAVAEATWATIKAAIADR